MRSLSSALLLGLCLTGCASYDLATTADSGYELYDGDVSDTGAAGAMADAPPADADAASDTGTEAFTPVATHWAIGGQLLIVNGLIDAAQSPLQVTLSGSGPSACGPAINTLIHNTSAVEALDPSVNLLASWSVSFGPVVTQGCELPLGRLSAEDTLWIAFGPIDPVLQPAIDTSGLSTTADTLLGLYLQMNPNDPVYIVGVAGTSDNFNGIAPSETGLQDGLYELRSLYRLAL